MDKVVYISLEYIIMHMLYIMRVLIFMDPDKGCKRSFIWGRKGCAWETNAKNKKLSKLTYLTLLQYLTNNWLAITSCFSIIYLYGQYLKFICSKIPRKYERSWISIHRFNRSCAHKMFRSLFDKEPNFDIKRGGVKFYEK